MKNKYRRTLIFLLTVGSHLLSSGALTLEEAIEEALGAHPDIRIAQARTLEAEAAEAVERAGNFPHLGVRAGYMQTTNPMQGFGSVLSQGTFDNGIDFNDVGQIDAFTAALEGRYRVYSGGARKARIKSAAALLDAGKSGELAAALAMEEAVVRAYFGIRQADEVGVSIESGIRVLEENLRVSVIREEAGELIRTERLNLEVELAALKRELLAQQHQAKLARTQLAFLLGKPTGSGIELAVEDSTIEKIVFPEDLSIANRPELRASRSQVQAAGYVLEASRAGRLPTVDAYASWQADKGWRRSGDGNSWTAGVVMNFPIFDGYTTRSQAMAALAREHMAKEQLRRLELGLELELEKARLAHELAIAQKEVAYQQVSQAEEAAQLSRERFAAGALLSTELIGVEGRLVEANVQLALATSQERIALAHLRSVAGYRILN